ncbi:MAG: thioredoxin family protein [Chitinophagaceae bacterium]|nr:thioredoxin family protein [Chitinophagaceae bacterium]
MRRILLAGALLISMFSLAQTQYEVSNDGQDKILKGLINRELIANDTSFKWYKQNQAGYKPNEIALNALKEKSSALQLIVFAGTWCSDTKYILPKLFVLIDAGGFSQDRVTLIGVGRDKKTIGHLAEALGIINVPTIIVMKEGKEIGRVVEYGKTGIWDKELGEIINGGK